MPCNTGPSMISLLSLPPPPLLPLPYFIVYSYIFICSNILIVVLTAQSPVSTHGDTIIITGNYLMSYCASNVTVAGGQCDKLEFSGNMIYCNMSSIPLGSSEIALDFGSESLKLNVMYLALSL